MVIKETLIRESIKQGILIRDESSKLFKIDRGVTDGIFDFLVEKQDIIGRDRWTFSKKNARDLIDRCVWRLCLFYSKNKLNKKYRNLKNNYSLKISLKVTIKHWDEAGKLS